MRVDLTKMEADSTTVENDCYDFCESSETERESTLIDTLLKYDGFFQDVISPMLKKGQEDRLLSWMKHNSLIPSSPKCSNESPGCEMVWKETSRVVDKFQWRCTNCNQKIPIRENSFFKHLFCTLSMSFKIILAWCQDVEFNEVAVALGLKKNIVSNIYEKIEKIVSSQSPTMLGGPGSVLLVELFPTSIGEQLHPDSSRNDSCPSPKPHTKILCLADTKQVPTRYWLNVLYGFVTVQTENNNTKPKKLDICEEAMNVLEKHVLPGGYCALGGGPSLAPLAEIAMNANIFTGVAQVSSLNAQSNIGMQTFLSCEVWKWAMRVCEASQDLTRAKLQSYLSCSLWRRQMAVERRDPFPTVLRLIATHDHSLCNSTRKNSHRKK